MRFNPTSPLIKSLMLIAIVLLSAYLWMNGVLAHPGTDGGWVYHYQSLVSGTLALVAGCFALISTHMALSADERARAIKAEIYWNRFVLDLEVFVEFVTNDLLFEDSYLAQTATKKDELLKTCREFFDSFAQAYPRELFVIDNMQFLAPDKRTLMHAMYARFWKIEALMAKKFWHDEGGEKQACIDGASELVKLLTLLSRHIKMPEQALSAALNFEKIVQENI